MGHMAVEIAGTVDKALSGAQTVPPHAALNVSIRQRHGNSHEPFQLDASFSTPAGITILFGPSGAGKTTLLNCLAGLVRPDAGTITAGGRVLFDANTHVHVPVSHRRVGYVFQDLALFPHLSALANVAYGLSHVAEHERRGRIDEILSSFRIEHVRQRKPAEISGGERQRVALARALVTDPCLLLLDEPLSGLDAPTKSKLVEDLRAWNQAHAIPILYVTHSREEAFALGERVLVMESGRIIAQGTPHEVLRAPRQETVAQLAGFENIFDAQVTAHHEERGTLTCQLQSSSIFLETPLVRAEVGSLLRVAISAGDILLATAQPAGLSARNILPGKVVSLDQRDVIVAAVVDCGVRMEVHLTLSARDSLHLQPGREVWVVIKTHSCHLMAG
jgi:molybdate transport system ATP-binding protein